VAEQKIGPGDLGPSVAEGVTAQQCVGAWLDLMGTCEQFLLAGLRREIGPGGDLQAAYRQWYAKQMEEHDRMMLHLLEEFARREGSHAC